jgi:hypothetical protein
MLRGGQLRFPPVLQFLPNLHLVERGWIERYGFHVINHGRDLQPGEALDHHVLPF